MIKVSLIGGLGNQMFQYATGKALALKHNTNLGFDLTFSSFNFSGVTKWPYQLNQFGIDCQVLPNFITPVWSIFKGLPLIKSLAGFEFYKEAVPYKYDYRIEQIGSNAYLFGYFQDYRYFDSIKESLKKDFTIVKPLSDKAKLWFNKIESTNSCSIHIRRGDYAKNPKALAFHGLMDKEYYQRAIAAVKESDTEFFIFSDEPEWVKANLQFEGNIHFVESASALEDQFLMRNCKNHIIANSSFSWWAAYLGVNPNKKVIAPQQWLAITSIDTSGFCPAEWVRV